MNEIKKHAKMISECMRECYAIGWKHCSESTFPHPDPVQRKIRMEKTISEILERVWITKK